GSARRAGHRHALTARRSVGKAADARAGRRGGAMTKADLIESVASKLDLPKGQAERAINTIFDDIVAALRNGAKVNSRGFGTFAGSARKARTGRNPKTGEAIQIAASKSAKFKAGKTLKDSLN